ncbi:MAG: hypothetical protein ABJY83_23250 [Roseibium sp.]
MRSARLDVPSAVIAHLARDPMALVISAIGKGFEVLLFISNHFGRCGDRHWLRSSRDDFKGDEKSHHTRSRHCTA